MVVAKATAMMTVNAQAAVAKARRSTQQRSSRCLSTRTRHFVSRLRLQRILRQMDPTRPGASAVDCRRVWPTTLRKKKRVIGALSRRGIWWLTSGTLILPMQHAAGIHQIRTLLRYRRSSCLSLASTYRGRSSTPSWALCDAAAWIREPRGDGTVIYGSREDHGGAAHMRDSGSR